jgi:hypothetical protein
MTHRTFSHVILAFAAVVLCCWSASAQAPAPSPTSEALQQTDEPISQTITLNKGQKQEFEFTVAKLGSITIQLHQDAAANAGDEQTPLAIGSVKVSIRSKDAGFENWVIEQYTDADGTYTFECLRPGKYKIEIDPGTLPEEAAHTKT